MKIQVIKPFTDKYTRLRHNAGEEIEITDERAQELTAKGFVSANGAPEKIEVKAEKEKVEGVTFSTAKPKRGNNKQTTGDPDSNK
jgi:hypothetical protein